MLFCKSEDVWLENTKVNSKQITSVVFTGNSLPGSLVFFFFFFMYIVDVKILLDISLARWSWYWIGTKLQFGVYDQCKSFASPSKAKKGGCFFRGEKGVRKVPVNRTRGFSGTEALPGKELSLCSCWVLRLSRGAGAPPSGLLSLFNWDFGLLTF